MRITLCCACLIGAMGLASGQAAATAELRLRGDRFKPLTADELTPQQKTFVEDIMKGPAPNLNGPYNVLLRSPEMGDLAHQFGIYTRFHSTVPRKLNELAIIMAARFWNSQFVWFAHRRAAQDAGLSQAIVDAIAEKKRPASMQPDEEAVYNFADELLNRREVSDATFAAAKDKLGEQGVVDLVAGMGYFQLISMFINLDRYPMPPGVKPELK
jgi:4-carboxymuconolactone decarboxylase